jgi:hypothetical protein
LVDSIYASQTAGGYFGNSSDHEVPFGLTVNLNMQKYAVLM